MAQVEGMNESFILHVNYQNTFWYHSSIWEFHVFDESASSEWDRCVETETLLDEHGRKW